MITLSESTMSLSPLNGTRHSILITPNCHSPEVIWYIIFHLLETGIGPLAFDETEESDKPQLIRTKRVKSSEFQAKEREDTRRDWPGASRSDCSTKLQEEYTQF